MKKFLFALIVFLASTSTLQVFAENQAPEYSIHNMQNEPVSLSDKKDKVIMLNSWATWCEPCREEMPGLEKLDQEFSVYDFEVIGVNVDVTASEDKIKQFLDDLGITYTVWKDPNDKFTRTFKSIGVPHTLLIDKEGQIIHEWRGEFDPLSDDTKTRVKVALGLVEQDTTLLQVESIGLVVAFSAGFLSFLSPCVLPLVPAYTSFITGLSMKELSSGQKTKQSSVKVQTIALRRGSLFVLGFSLIFIALGSSVALVGSFFLDASTWIERIGGIIIILFGLHLLGLLKIPWLQRQAKFDISKRSTKNAGSFFVGMAFGAGWTPCIGPILAGILTIAASSSSVGIGALLLSIYSAGLAIPFYAISPCNRQIFDIL